MDVPADDSEGSRLQNENPNAPKNHSPGIASLISANSHNAIFDVCHGGELATIARRGTRIEWSRNLTVADGDSTKLKDARLQRRAASLPKTIQKPNVVSWYWQVTRLAANTSTTAITAERITPNA